MERKELDILAERLDGLTRERLRDTLPSFASLVEWSENAKATVTHVLLPTYDTDNQVEPSSNWVADVGNSIMNEVMSRIEAWGNRHNNKPLQRNWDDHSIICRIDGRWRTGWNCLDLEGIDRLIISKTASIRFAFWIENTPRMDLVAHVYVELLSRSELIELWQPR